MVLSLHGPNANAGKARAKSAIRIRDKDRIPPSATDLLRQTVDYSNGSAEMKVNAETEAPYRAKLWELIGYGSGSISKDRAIYGLAELMGCSPQATRDYYNKMKSEDGPLEEFKEKGTNQKRVRMKRGYLP